MAAEPDAAAAITAARWRPAQAAADDLLADPFAWLEAERTALLSAIQQAATPDPAAATGEAIGRLAQLTWRLTGACAGFFQLRAYRDDWRHACQLALDAARRAGDQRGEAWMLVELAELSGDEDRFEEAVVLADQARSLHREVGDRHGEAYALFTAANVQEFRGRFDDAVADLQRASERYEDLGDEQGRAWVLHNLGRIHHQQGRLPEAVSHFEQALTASRPTGDRRLEAMVPAARDTGHPRYDPGCDGRPCGRPSQPARSTPLVPGPWSAVARRQGRATRPAGRCHPAVRSRPPGASPVSRYGRSSAVTLVRYTGTVSSAVKPAATLPVTFASCWAEPSPKTLSESSDVCARLVTLWP